MACYKTLHRVIIFATSSTHSLAPIVALIVPLCIVVSAVFTLIGVCIVASGYVHESSSGSITQYGASILKFGFIIRMVADVTSVLVAGWLMLALQRERPNQVVLRLGWMLVFAIAILTVGHLALVPF